MRTILLLALTLLFPVNNQAQVVLTRDLEGKVINPTELAYEKLITKPNRIDTSLFHVDSIANFFRTRTAVNASPVSEYLVATIIGKEVTLLSAFHSRYGIVYLIRKAHRASPTYYQVYEQITVAKFAYGWTLYGISPTLFRRRDIAKRTRCTPDAVDCIDNVSRQIELLHENAIIYRTKHLIGKGKCQQVVEKAHEVDIERLKVEGSLKFPVPPENQACYCPCET